MYKYILPLLFLSSCITQKKCLERFPPQLIVKDSIIFKDTTIYIDTTVYLPGEVLTIHDTIPCPINYRKTIKGERGSVDVVIDNGVLTVNSNCDEYKKKISIAKKLALKEFYRYTREIHDRPIKRLSWWQKTIQILGYILLGYIVLRIGVAIVRKYTKLQIPFL